MQNKLSLLLFLGYCTLSQGIFLTSAIAQVIPDGTTSTTVEVDGTINDGERAGGNFSLNAPKGHLPALSSLFWDYQLGVSDLSRAEYHERFFGLVQRFKKCNI
ncbi:MAG: hypothetical protein QNJ55_29475 [Xenococcus sp. MO_188.B8]|nr:hypothetical protein [Xenococcus sp. MO_188.B8]